MGRERGAGNELLILGAVLLLALLGTALFVRWVDCPDCNALKQAYFEQLRRERELPQDEPGCDRCGDVMTVSLLNRWLWKPSERTP